MINAAAVYIYYNAEINIIVDINVRVSPTLRLNNFTEHLVSGIAHYTFYKKTTVGKCTEESVCQ